MPSYCPPFLKTSPRCLALVLVLWVWGSANPLLAAKLDPRQLADHVLIHRDGFGVPHVFGENEASVVFGFGYAQAEDYFWQVEDGYIMALGRYAEVHGPKGLNSDLLNRAYEIVPRSRRDFAALDAKSKSLFAAFVAGINFYLETHPDVHPRLIQKFEPWHVLAYHRHVALELTFRFVGVEGSSYLPRHNPHVWTATGSNGWAISGKKTASGNAMLLANPHMPLFGFAQMMEAHLYCEETEDTPGWNFIGAGFYGSPTLALGHNDRLGWTLVTNEPDIADTWKVKFDHPERPLDYWYDGGWRSAESWQETIVVRKSRTVESRSFVFRKTHHGPIVAQLEDGSMLAARISGLFDAIPMRQWLHMAQADTLAEFRQALSMMQILYMNILYADVEGNIQYIYTGRVPRRNPDFDWTRPVDGSDPATEWLGFHTLEELPQVLNPSAGFVQNCNSTPLITTDDDNPRAEDFPSYMIGDIHQTKRRALRSLEMLRSMDNITFEDWQDAAFDTEVYWARHELPKFAAKYEVLKSSNSNLAARVQPYLEHLLEWDGRIAPESTAASLCHAWYEQLYGPDYPGETMREIYQGNPERQFESLCRAAYRLRTMYGKWKVPYAKVYRSQRQPQLSDLVDARFDDRELSLPALGGHGPMGCILTQYYSPSMDIPWVISQRKRYGLVGTSYLATYEFTPTGVKGASLVPFGTSGSPESRHFFDQAKLLKKKQLKPELFTKQQVLANCVESYHPGQR